MKKKLFAGLVIGVLLLGLTSFAQALLITPTGYGSSPTNWIFTGSGQNEWQGLPGSTTSTSKILTYITDTLNIALGTEQYKQDVGAASDTGALKDNYSTVYNNDNSGATITYSTGASFVPGYLLVKDGNHDPIWYLFNLSNIWEGKEQLVLSSFWTGDGEISHVALYGGSSNPVPEPATLLLFGTGIAGLAAVGRRKRS